MSDIDYVGQLTERQKGHLPDHMSLEWLEARPGYVRGRFEIKPHHLALLFQPFRQVDTGLTRRHDGTGLGLAICRRLADLLGGYISADSEWQQGSTFTVLLPLESGHKP